MQEALDPILVTQGLLATRALVDSRREEAARRLADAFDVNPVVARIRVGELFPTSANGQLTL